MSLNSGGSAGRCPATSCCTGSGGGSTGCVAAGSAGCCCGTGAFCGSSIFLHAPTESRSEEHTSELQSLMRISYAVFCLKKKKQQISKQKKITDNTVSIPS